MTKVVRLALLIPDLRCGGLERLTLDLARTWSDLGHSVDLIVLQARGELLHEIDPRVRLIDLHAPRLRSAVLPLFRYLRKQSPAVLWAHLWPLTSVAVLSWLLACKPSQLWLAEHTTLSISVRQELNLSLALVKLLIRLTYPLATGLTAVSNGVANDLHSLGVPSDQRIDVIPNPAAIGRSFSPLPTIEAKALWGETCAPRILTVGSLKEQKNHVLLLDALSLIPKVYKPRLTILGDGPLRVELEQHAESLGLTNQVQFLGFVSDPEPWYRSADLFVLSSSWEGFGNVIVEALECGLQVVSTDCPNGPAEILESGRYGRLVPLGDPLALANAITKSFFEKSDRAHLNRRAQDFSLKIIAERYLKVFGFADHV